MFKMIGNRYPKTFPLTTFTYGHNCYDKLTDVTRVSKGMTVLPTRAQDRTKESGGYNVSGDEGYVENHTPTYLRNESTVNVGYVI